MADIDVVWSRISHHAGETFLTATNLSLQYTVHGNSLRVTRDGREINRSLSRTNFAKALHQMPAARPSDIRARQGSSYTWAILMDPRIRATDY